MKYIFFIVRHSIFLSTFFLIFCISFLILSVIYTQKRVGEFETSAAITATTPQTNPKPTLQVVATHSAHLKKIDQQNADNLTPVPPKKSTSSPTPSKSVLSKNITQQSSSVQTVSPTPTETLTPDHELTPTTSQAQEVLQALNAYRIQHGQGTLKWDNKLADFAQSQADKYAADGATDNHNNFKNLISSPTGFTQMGFSGLGENSSYGYPFNATDLIEKDYAADKPHDDNQLDPSWTDVGIGINGVASDIVFGKGKM